MKDTKKPISIRLNEATIKELNSLCKREGLSQGTLISILVHCAYLGDVSEEQLDEWYKIGRM